MIRVALYIRVSTEEQALHGLSLEAQREALLSYAKEHNYQIVGIYEDEGISARKKFYKRTEFVRLITDVEDKKIDMILFTKLDRWFRNISDYYKVQEILEKNNVNWKTIFENYDTTTASGRLHINIMLSVAQDEADRTSERIKDVFKHKIMNGEHPNTSVAFGYRLLDKRLVIDAEKANVVREVFHQYELKRSICATQRWYIKKYNENVTYDFISRMLKNEIYIGKKRANENYCEPIISKEQFDRVNSITKQPFSRQGTTGLTYIFSALVKCDTCGRYMNGLVAYNPKPTKYYGCRYGMRFTSCTHNLRCREDLIEKQALLELNQYICTNISRIVIRTNTKKYNKNGPDVIQKKIRKLKELYVLDLISIEDYTNDYNKYRNELTINLEKEKEEIHKKDISYITNFILGANYMEIYKQLNEETKRCFWHQIIDSIQISDKNNIRFIFK